MKIAKIWAIVWPVTVALLAGVLLGFAIGRWKYKVPFYSIRRTGFVEQQGMMFGHADTLIIGDSLTEQADLSDVCGRTFAAGVGGARMEESMQIAGSLLPALEPRTVIVAVGANYFTVFDEYDTLVRDYPVLLERLRGRRLILVGVVNSAKASAFIAQQAKARGAIYVPPVLGPLQADGLHHTLDGSIRFRKSLVDACGKLGDGN